MVVETKDVNRFFETVGDGFRAAVDAGQRTQEAFLRTSQEAWKRPGDFDKFFNRGERVMRDCVPFVERNMETFADAVNTNFRKGIEIFKDTVEMTTHANQGDVYNKTRKLWDTAFEAARFNFDVFTKMTKQSMDAFTSLCESAGCSDETTRPTSGNQQTSRPQNSQHEGNQHQAKAKHNNS